MIARVCGRGWLILPIRPRICGRIRPVVRLPLRNGWYSMANAAAFIAGEPEGCKMPGWMHRANAVRSRAWAKVEHVFAEQKVRMSLFIRTIARHRAEVMITLANMAYHMKRWRVGSRERCARLKQNRASSPVTRLERRTAPGMKAAKTADHTHRATILTKSRCCQRCPCPLSS